MRFSRKLTVTAGVVASTLAAGIAFAYWTTSGSGSGAGSTTAGVLNQLGITNAALTAMYPGDSSQPLAVSVTNNSTDNSRVYVTTLKAYVTTDKGANCDGSNFKLNGAAAPSTDLTAVEILWTAQDIAHGATVAAGANTIQFNNTGASQDLCKSAVVTIHYLAI